MGWLLESDRPAGEAPVPSTVHWDDWLGVAPVLKGEQGTLIIPHVAMPVLLPEEKFAAYKLPEVGGVDHYVQWADACRGEGKTTSHFDYAGPLTEAVLLGTVAIRTPHETLQWDAEALKIANSATANGLLTKQYRPGWESQRV